jgi:hypothetical protein
MATRLKPGLLPRGQADAAAATRSGRAPAPGQAELARLRGVVEEQHRRLRVVRGEAAAAAEPSGADDVGVVAESFPATCAKPRVTPRGLARLLDEARLRLELRDSSLGRAIDAAWPERRAEVPVLRPSPGHAAYALRSVPGVPNVVLALFGKQHGEAKAAIDRVLAEQQADEPFIPVFLTNDADFRLLREQRLVFEYFPFVLDEAAPPPEPGWSAYFLEALELTMRRWGVRQIVVL